MDVAHKIYEKMRVVGLSETEYFRLKGMLQEAYNGVTPPVNWEDILKIDNMKDAFPGWDDYL